MKKIMIKIEKIELPKDMAEIKINEIIDYINQGKE